MLSRFKRHFASLFPELDLELRSRRARRHSQRLERAWGCADLSRKLVRHYGPRVLRGPFRGLEFPPLVHARHLAPKLVGSYERELHPVWERVLRSDYPEVLDVGCAEGYYAVGLALRMPGATVHAFDTDPWARAATGALADANHALNVEVHGPCTPDWLRSRLRPGSFILSDCEGYEDVLFDPAAAPGLASCDLLVELHERRAPGVSARLARGFEATHHVERIPPAERSPLDPAAFPDLSSAERALAVDELRGEPNAWLFLRSRSRA